MRRGIAAWAALAGVTALATLLSCADFGSPFVPEPATVTILGASRLSVRTGEALDLEAEVRDAAGRVIPSAAVEWISSAPATAELEPRGPLVGRARAAGVGNAMIVARSGRVQSPPLELSVVPRDAASVRITMPSSPMSLGVGQTAQFAAEVRDNAGGILPDPALVWRSSAPSIVSVDGAGLAQALAPGTATVQAQSGEVLSAGVAVTVRNPAPSYAAVIQPVWNRNCISCHGTDGGLSLAGNAYDRIVNVASTQNRAFKRIVPGDPDASYLLRKLEGCSTVGCIGGGMPPGAPLPAAQIQLIRDWVAGGCPR